MTTPPAFGFPSLLAALLILATPVAARSQARATAEKPADIAVFLDAALVRTAYAGTSQAGLVAGADYTRFLQRYSLGISLEGRASYTPVLAVVGERVFSGGIRLETTRFRSFRPYGDFMAGAGKVSFDSPPGVTDHAPVYTYGGGVDYDVSPRFSAKLDAQASHWRLNASDIREPAIVSVGLVYHLSLGKRFGR